MIGSFWNLCRACPSMPVDKLHSEYRSTYRWHEYTGPRQEVVRRAPQANAAPLEKSNDIQHSSRSHDDEFNSDSITKMEPAMPRRKKYPDLAYRHHEFLVSDGGMSNETADRARSEERGGSNWRPSRRSKSEGPARCGVEGNGIRERERRRESDPDVENMFAWPQGHTSRRDATDSSAPRKSKSMGALKANANAAMVHKKRIDMENKDASELEPLVDDRNNQDKPKEKFNSEYKKKFRPFSQYEYSEGRFTKPELEKEIPQNCDKHNDSWYREVVELRKKAGEYKDRGWSSKLAPDRISDMYNKQVELWDQVSRRSSLSALSLASMTHKSYTKEEKEQDNNKKSSPSKAYRNAENSARMIRDIIRHHLERTTGGSEEIDGLILSPTREKLEPTVPRKDDDSRGSQKNSPKKNSPVKSSSLKRTNQKATKAAPIKLRSQSVGPTTNVTAEKRSPKRQSRSSTVKERKTPTNTPSNKRPRPSSLNTTASSRSKYSSVASKNEDDRLAKSNSKSLGAKELRKGNQGAEPPKTDSNASVCEVKNGDEAESLNYEPVIKSPPEPTRVKSPEQILMRSPDPVNWTVPLDTGKTFTVTQNVKDGDLSSRPHSEVKAWTPPDMPLPVAQSAPPMLTDQNKEQGMDLAVKA